MDKRDEMILEKSLREEMKKVRDTAMVSSARAICSVVLAKARDKSKTNDERLNDIIDFCEISLGIKNTNNDTKENADG